MIIWDLTSPILITSKTELVSLNKEEAQNFINTYHTILSVIQMILWLRIILSVELNLRVSIG